jgi:hypothetical protein
MNYGKPTDIQTAIMTEAQKRSGIFIEADLSKLIRYGGFDAIGSKGMYSRPQTSSWGEVIPETILINVPFEHTHATSVLFHEMAHATGAPERLDRKFPNRPSKEFICVEEATAELTAAKLMAHFNLATQDTNSLSSQYVTDFLLHVPDQKAYIVVEAQAEAAKKYILDNWLVDFNQVKKEAA